MFAVVAGVQTCALPICVSFGDLGLGENIVRALADLGAAAPFAIQAATISEIIAGRYMLARGLTGSGKPIAFGAPMAENVLSSEERRAGKECVRTGKSRWRPCH